MAFDLTDINNAHLISLPIVVEGKIYFPRLWPWVENYHSELCCT